MLISLPERYALIPLLPHQGNFQVLTRLKNLRSALELGESEQHARRLTIVNDTIVPVSPETDPGEIAALTEVALHEELVKIVVTTLKDAETREALPMSLLALYERTVREPDDAAVREAVSIVGGG